MYKFLVFVFGFSFITNAQHHISMQCKLDENEKTIAIKQEILYKNNSKTALNHIVLNDWNHAFSHKETVLAKRFSDEFVRSFYFAPSENLGNTSIISIQGIDNELEWERENTEFIKVKLRQLLLPNEEVLIKLDYVVKIPHSKYTRYGFEGNSFVLNDWFLVPAVLENNEFIKHNHTNTDDKLYPKIDYQIDFTVPDDYSITSCLESKELTKNTLQLYGKDILHFSVYVEPKNTFQYFVNDKITIATNIEVKNVNQIKKAIVIDRISDFVFEKLGAYPFSKMTVSETDYNRNQIYGLNQLPTFLSPFPNEFIFEIQFLKTYLQNFLTKGMQINHRENHYITDAILIYLMMEYMDEFYPDVKMTGRLASFKIAKGYKFNQITINEHYLYFYLMMSRKNLDQPLLLSKDKLTKFNEQIAIKYKAGLLLKYLEHYDKKENILKSIENFYQNATKNYLTEKDFERELKANCEKNINWFFDQLLTTRSLIDYSIKSIQKQDNQIVVKIKNNSNTAVPIPIYGFKNKAIVYKKWMPIIKKDTIILLPDSLDQIVLNYKNEVPEHNHKDNYRKTNPFLGFHKPIKFTLLEDIENPKYNQIIYLPSVEYNYYDGIRLGLRFSNETMIDRPFTFLIQPEYGTTSQQITGSARFDYQDLNRNSRWFNTKYSISGTFSNYAPDAKFYKFTPSIQWRIRPDNFRNNERQNILLRNVFIKRDPSEFLVNEEINQNYNIINLRYTYFKNELAQYKLLNIDSQFSNQFSKISTIVEYRKLFQNQRQINLRWYSGVFLHRNIDNSFFDFAVDRPTDYLFDYNYYARSNEKGFFSQQYIAAEGGFKSRFDTRFANQWISSINTSATIWNWIEVYADFGLVKNKGIKPEFIYNSGIKLNFLPDYFELYFPIHTNYGWEVNQPNYDEKIRFVITLSAKTLTGLFTRKWY
ncbi:MAG: aminopeptidase [Flavobacterium sp.]